MSRKRHQLVQSLVVVLLLTVIGAYGRALGSDSAPPKPVMPIASSNGEPSANLLERSGWKMTRTRGRKDDETFVSLMKTAEALQSDPDFVGLMVRCDPKGKIELVLVVVTPLPPKSLPKVTLGAGENTASFEGTMIAGGAGISLPNEASALAARDWQAIPTLSVEVSNDGNRINGVVDMRGFAAAYRNLLGNCPG